jgi:hypothetical protein
MILNTKLSHDAEYLGDVQENRVGIDKSNIDFITTLLTSNLYSKPLESFLRETVANAYDSHVEAGTNEHILILIQDINQYKTYRISVRDYGTGVSPERFDKIYKNIGSSTKRQSNDFIGMFGIGRFSCLSCADVAQITSYYNGKKYSYVMYKNGGGINIDQLSVIEGDFKNGLEVSIEKYIYNHNDLINAIRKLCLFDRLHISYKGNNSVISSKVADFNDRKVTHFNTFSRCSWLQDNNFFKVGNVIYDYDKYWLNTRDGLIIDLPMGSVDITPNREALQFTDFTNNNIKARIADVKQELQDIVNSRINGNMTLSKFCDSFVFSSSYVVTEKDEQISIDRDDVQVDFNLITLDGEKLPEGYVKFLNSAKYLGIDKAFIHKFINNSYKNKRAFTRALSPTFKHLLLDKVDLIDKVDKVTKQVTSKYITENATKTAVILVYGGLDSFKNSIEDYVAKDLDKSDNVNVRECIDFTFRRIPIKVMSNDSVPYSYVEAYKAEQRDKRNKSKKVNTGEVPMRKYHTYGYSIKRLSDLPNKGLVVYSTHTQDDYTLKQISDLVPCTSGLACVITVKSEYIKLLEGNKRFMTVENFMFLRNSILSKIVTALIIRRNFYEVSSKYDINLTEMPIYREFVKKYKEQIQCLGYWSSSETKTSIFRYYESRNWVNQCDIAYFSLTEKEAESYKGWKDLEEHKYDIVRQIAYKKYGRLPKIGLTPSIAPKLT